MAQNPCARRDSGHRAHYRRSPGDVVGCDPARAVPVAAGGAGRDRRTVGRSTILRAVPAVLRPAPRAAVDPDGMVPAADVLAVPLPARLRSTLPGGDRQLGLAAVLSH